MNIFNSEIREVLGILGSKLSNKSEMYFFNIFNFKSSNEAELRNNYNCDEFK